LRDPRPEVGGAFFAAAPLAIYAAAWPGTLSALPASGWRLGGLVLTLLAFLSTGLLACRDARLARGSGTLAITLTIGLGWALLLASPFAALWAGWAAIALLWSLWVPAPRQEPARPTLSWKVGAARGASRIALVSWFASLVVGGELDVVGVVAVGGAIGVAAVLTVVWSVGAVRTQRSPSLAALAAVAAAALGVLASGTHSAGGLTAAVLAPAGAHFAIGSVGGREDAEPWWTTLAYHPARLMSATFLALCLAGAVLLSLPASASSGHSIGLLDAAFTATSAVCVTGLVVVDTGTAFSGLGQAILLFLIQLGGLGIMAFSSAAFLFMGRRMSLRHEGAVAQLMSPADRGSLHSVVRRVLGVTFALELGGAALLTLLFALGGDSVGDAAWRGVFTAISAFCNAGFALQADSLVPYAANPWILNIVGVLIVAGGLSPAVVVALPDLVRRRRTSVQIRLAVWTSVVLLVLGGVAFAAIEWTGALAGLGLADRLHNAWFQSITLRTAGFNSVPLESLQPATVTWALLWMFIGGSPGGTAGGAKTTTIAALCLGVAAAIRGEAEAGAFGRRIPHRTVYKAAAIATIGVAVAVASALAIQLTQAMPPDVAIFEVVSALGTVGLSLGGTAMLDGVGKVVIMLCMFMGRVGPLTLFMVLGTRVLRSPVRQPMEEIEVG
jgi:trk system potassium uptake protein TrkH